MRVLTEAWLVIALSVGFGAGLAGVHAALRDRIRANQAAEIRAQIPKLVPGADAGRSEEVRPGVFRALDAGGRPVGWVLQGKDQGFADVVQILVGLDEEGGKLTGIYVLDNKETPGLGNRIEEAEWRAQFAGAPAREPLRTVKGAPSGPGQVRAVTGATISSETVTRIVNATVAEWRKSRAAGKD